MKIGIVTIACGCNYGNKLQNYAVQEILKKLDSEFEVVTMKRNYSKHLLLGKCRRFLFPSPKKMSKSELKKQKNFNEFEQKNIVMSNEILYFKRAFHNFLVQKKYDYFVCGSDQIWNPLFPTTSHIDFLTFAESKKRIAYAASFGIDKIPLKAQPIYRKWLNQIKYISVREQKGADIINQLIGKKSVVLLDPTMMLSKEEWIQIEQAPKTQPNFPYILTYFLGDCTENRKQYIQQIRTLFCLEIVDLMDIENVYYSSNPAEFIWLIEHAKLICTDSFHGSVFSIILEKPFLIFERLEEDAYAAMNSRIETLLTTFGLEDRKLTNDIYDENYIFCKKNGKIKTILEIEKNRTEQYLKKSFNI